MLVRVVCACMSSDDIGDTMFPNLNAIECACKRAVVEMSLNSPQHNVLIKRLCMYRRSLRLKIHMGLERRLPRHQMYPRQETTTAVDAESLSSKLGKRLTGLLDSITAGVAMLPYNLQQLIKPRLRAHIKWISLFMLEYERC